MMIFLGETEGDMEWLHTVHRVPADMRCAILTGNEDCPSKIEAWREFNPDYRTPADFVFIREEG